MCDFCFGPVYDRYLTPLMTISRFGNIDEVSKLVELHPEEVNKVHELDGWTPLICAIEGKNKEIVEYLISKGADVNHYDVDGWTPLFHAQVRKFKEIEELLKNNGAQLPNSSNFDSFMKNYLADEACLEALDGESDVEESMEWD